MPRFDRLRHDLRTPLNHIIGYSEMLLEESTEADSSAFVAELDRIRADGQRVLALVERFFESMPHRPPGVTLQELAVATTGLLAGMADSVRTLEQMPDMEDTRPSINADLSRIALAVGRLQSLIAESDKALVESAGAEAAESGDRSQLVRDAPRGRILVVDDDFGNRQMLSRRIERDGYQVSQAESGEDALRLLAEQPIDLVLLDVMMPGVDGFEVLRRLKADDRLRSVPVLMISALDETSSVVRCIEMGADDYLSKPFDPVILRARIGACLEKKRLRDAETEHLHALAEWNLTLEKRVAEQVSLVDRLTKLKRFFSPQLVDLIIAGGADDPLATHRREVTVCFLDLRGFTAFAEVSEPEDVMAVLKEYHAEMGRLVMEHEGTLERFTGDGMMIFFNDPVVVANPAERAVLMALEMRDAVARLSRRWKRMGYELDLGVGIAQGFATIGAIGFDGRWDYGAIGSVTNLAARLCAEARPGQILAERRVAAMTEEVVSSESLGDLALKGFRRPVAAFSILGIHGPRPDVEVLARSE